MQGIRHARSLAWIGLIWLVVAVLGLAACAPIVPPTPTPTWTPASTSTAAAQPSAGPTQSASPTGSVAPASTGSRAIPGIVITRSTLKLPGGRSRAVALALGSQVLLCGGLTTDGQTSGSILEVDLTTGHVRELGTLSTAVHDAGGAVLDGAGYLFGGGRTVAGSTIQRIGPAGTATTIGHLPAVRADLAAAFVDGEIVVIGGGTPALTDGRVLATADGHDLRAIGRLAVPVRYPAVAVFDGLVYVFGGATLRGDTNVIQVLDPTTGGVRIVGHLPQPVSHASALVIGQTVLIAGGRSGGRAQDRVLRIRPPIGTVSVAGRLPTPASDMAAVVVDGVGYLIGGETTGPIGSIVTISIQ